MPIIDTDSLKISYTDTGTGVPVVFVPGLVGSKEWFSYQSVGLSDHYRVISYDLRRARGKSNYSLDILVDDLARLLAELRLPSAVVAGCSLGSLVALKFAVAYPQRCLELVLCSAAPTFAKVPEYELCENLLPVKPVEESFFARVRKKLFASKTAVDQAHDSLSPFARHAAELEHASLAARLRILRETDLTPILEEVGVPTLIIAGSLDMPHILGGSQILDQRIPDTLLEVIEDADQFCFYTRHDLFNAIVADFLAHRIVRP